MRSGIWDKPKSDYKIRDHDFLNWNVKYLLWENKLMRDYKYTRESAQMQKFQLSSLELVYDRTTDSAEASVPVRFSAEPPNHLPNHF